MTIRREILWLGFGLLSPHNLCNPTIYLSIDHDEAKHDNHQTGTPIIGNLNIMSPTTNFPSLTIKVWFCDFSYHFMEQPWILVGVDASSHRLASRYPTKDTGYAVVLMTNRCQDVCHPWVQEIYRFEGEMGSGISMIPLTSGPSSDFAGIEINSSLLYRMYSPSLYSPAGFNIPNRLPSRPEHEG